MALEESKKEGPGSAKLAKKKKEVKIKQKHQAWVESFLPFFPCPEIATFLHVLFHCLAVAASTLPAVLIIILLG